mgnify:CR=1 FL=1
MKKTAIFLIAGLMVVLAVFALGFYKGYKYTVENCTPTYGEFRELEEFNRLVVEEVEKIRGAQPIGIIPGALWETEMKITPKGAMWRVSAPKRVDKDGHRRFPAEVGQHVPAVPIPFGSHHQYGRCGKRS